MMMMTQPPKKKTTKTESSWASMSNRWMAMSIAIDVTRRRLLSKREMVGAASNFQK